VTDEDIQDRRRWDPFAPHTPAPAPDTEDDDDSSTVVDPVDELDALSKAELVQRATDAGVATYGNKTQIKERLRQASQ
jgi:hypothetical protein